MTTKPQSESGRKSEHRIWTLFAVFFKISTVSVGGGLAMLPLISREFVEKRNWMTDEEMVDVVAVMQSMPGIIAVNMGILVGYRTVGVWGAVSAAFGVAIPPFVVITVVAAFISFFKDNRQLAHVFLGIRAAVCALILVSVIKLAKPILKDKLALGIALIAFVGLVFFNFNAIWMIIAGGVFGLGLGLYQFLYFKSKIENGKHEDGE